MSVIEYRHVIVASFFAAIQICGRRVTELLSQQTRQGVVKVFSAHNHEDPADAFIVT